jgi:hypothetical protein
MNINDYLIDQAGYDWASLLRDWMPPLPQSFTLWLVNRFADTFVVFEDESVHMLDVGAGTLARLADNRDDFASKLDEGDNANIWLMIPLVDACREAGMTLPAGQCYGYKIPPCLGGQYELSNVELTDIAIHYSFLADIYRQTKDLPDGTPVHAVVTD